MNLGDPELELIDPTPNVHALFIQFDKMFFWTQLMSRAVVRWSKRMYSCAGICSYEGRGGLVDIALSEPLLKLRSRKDIVETLLHEMIHAYLFVTCRDQDRNGHGPNFKEHMYRINKSAGLNISIYHSFHDEVKLYQTHWWRCNGPCQTRRPHFGIVRRAENRAPNPKEYWWEDHRRKCGGTFIKIKEPEKRAKKSSMSKTKPNEDITKYIINNKTTNNNNNVTKPVLKDSNSIPAKTKSNSISILDISKKEPVIKLQYKKPPVLFEGKGQTLAGDRKTTKSLDVVEEVRNVWINKQLSITSGTPKKDEQVTETVRNIWAKKQLPAASTLGNNTKIYKGKQLIKNEKNTTIKRPVSVLNSNNYTVESDIKSSPVKLKKIDDYFKATSVLKSLYGEDIKLTQSSGDTQKLIAIHNKSNTSTVDKNTVDIIESVNCPICNALVSSQEINRHLDECLNKEVIKDICNEISNESPKVEKNVDDLSFIPIYQPNKELHDSIQDIKPEMINNNFDQPFVKVEPSTSKDNIKSICACCGETINKPLEQHLDECLAFFGNNTTIPDKGASTSSAIDTIVIDDDDDDDDDIFDESLTLNETGTKAPCPCCLEMVEQAEMNEHLSMCLS